MGQPLEAAKAGQLVEVDPESKLGEPLVAGGLPTYSFTVGDSEGNACGVHSECQVLMRHFCWRMS